MAAVHENSFAEPLQGKSIETVKLSYSPSYPGAISWSPDGRISVITDQCVYVLTPISASSHPSLNLEKTFVPACPMKQFHVDVGIDRKQISTDKGVLAWSLDPNVNTALQSAKSFQKVAWSPLNCDRNGRSAIATLFSDHQLRIHVSPTLGIKWKEAFDLSTVLCEYLKMNNFKIDADIMQPAVNVSIQPDHIDQSLNKSQYLQFVQRAQMLTFTSLHWFSEIYHTANDNCSSELNGSVDQNQFAVLVAGNQSGHVVFWKVAVPIGIGNPKGVQLEGFLNTQLSWPCSLSWQPVTSNQGLLAVGGIDGYVKVFSIKILSPASFTGVAEYVLWGDKDEMQVQWLEWLPPASKIDNSRYQLAACKGSSLILFSMILKDGVLTQKPTHRIITKVHRMPISGMAVSQNGTIVTCSLDGSVQMLSDNATWVRSVDYDTKKGFLCNGIGVSANDTFITLFLSPSTCTHQSLESHQTQVLFINIVCGPASIAWLLNSEHIKMDKKWDVCKALQYFIHKCTNVKEEVQHLVSTKDLETFSHNQLILRQHLLSLMVLTSKKDEQDANKTQLTEWSAQLECTVNDIYKHLATTTLKSWLEAQELGSVNHTDSVSALLICDFLVKKYKDSDVLDLIAQVYHSCNDTEGLNTLSSLEGETKGTALSQTTEMPMTTQCNHAEVMNGDKQLAVEQLDTDQTPTQVNSADLKDEGQSMVNFPAREKCPICENAIPVESLNFGTCLNGHKWQRCCASFAVCADLSPRCCQDCGRLVSISHPGSSPWMQNLLQSTSNCPFCLGFFCVSS